MIKNLSKTFNKVRVAEEVSKVFTKKDITVKLNFFIRTIGEQIKEANRT